MGCFNGIFRCRKAKQMEQDNDQKKGITTSPCLVARLMGLDSMPVFPCSSTPPISSISRSKSTSYLQTLPVFLTTDQRVKTSSVSFREVPTFLKQETDQDFFVLTFNADDKESNSSRRKVDESSVREKLKKMEVESCLQNSSPDSVLDNNTLFDMKEDEKIKERRRSSRQRRLSSELENLVQDGGVMKVIKKKEIAVEMIRKDEEIFQSNCKLGDEEVKTVNWIARNGWKSEQVEEIAVETGLEILSFLLLEVVKEFY